MHDELLVSGANPDRMHVKRLFNPSFIFDSPPSPSGSASRGQHPILSAMSNMNPSPYSTFKKPSTPSSSLGRNPEESTPILREILSASSSVPETKVSSPRFPFPNPTFFSNSPWSNPTGILPSPPYPFVSTNFSYQGRGLSPFNKWFRNILYHRGTLLRMCFLCKQVSNLMFSN